MCWSLEVSLASFIVGNISNIMLWFRNYNLDRPSALIMAYVISMQLCEALMWYDKTCGKNINKYASKIAHIIVITEPLMLGLIFLWFGKYHKKNVDLVKIIIGLCVVSVIIYLYYMWDHMTDQFFCSKPSGEHNLEWGWSGGDNIGNIYLDYIFWNLYILSMLLLCFLIESKRFKYFFTIYVGLTFAISRYIYKDTKSFGSWWCLQAVLMPILLLFFPQLGK